MLMMVKLLPMRGDSSFVLFLQHFNCNTHNYEAGKSSRLVFIFGNDEGLIMR